MFPKLFENVLLSRIKRNKMKLMIELNRFNELTVCCKSRRKIAGGLFLIIVVEYTKWHNNCVKIQLK